MDVLLCINVKSESENKVAHLCDAVCRLKGVEDISLDAVLNCLTGSARYGNGSVKSVLALDSSEEGTADSSP